ncbi:MAG: DUF7508 domain-containing protein [Bdellovibrionota bacterium]
MTPWTPFTRENVQKVPDGLLGVFQLSRGEQKISYVGRADVNMRESLSEMLDKGYTEFQWVQLPWTKETFEMHCRLYHHGGGRKKLDNTDHPYPPEGKLWQCTVSTATPSMCDG